MTRVSKEDVQRYKELLKEYAVLYDKLNKGMQNGYAKYNELVLQVASAAGYLRMIEDRKPELVEHKPENYRSWYRPINEKKHGSTVWTTINPTDT